MRLTRIDMDLITSGKPFFTTWRDLSNALAPLHMDQPAWVDRLHDIWKLGAPSPQSQVQNLKGYDERLQQAGNYEARLIFPKALASWIQDVCKAKGWSVTDIQAMALVNGTYIP